MANAINFSSNPFNTHSFVSTVVRTTRAAVLTLALPLLSTLGLTSCSQSDTTIAPETEIHSAAREAASVINTDTFDDTKMASFWSSELYTATSGLLSKEQRRVGSQAMRFSWKPSQYNGTNPSCHSELSTAPLPKDENERWYGYSMYLPSATMANDDQIANIMQWHDLPDPGSQGTVPPIAVELAPGNKLVIEYRSSNKPLVKPMQDVTSQKVLNLGTVKFDAWVDYVVHIKWDATGKTGLLQIWQDGKQIVNEQNISLGYVGTRPYWKVGLYCWTGKSSHTERTMYYDEVRMGDATATYNDMKPGRNNFTAR